MDCENDTSIPPSWPLHSAPGSVCDFEDIPDEVILQDALEFEALKETIYAEMDLFVDPDQDFLRDDPSTSTD
ncbi:hypothetical protein BGX29_004431, partial [Mortierella sp. GBA35]